MDARTPCPESNGSAASAGSAGLALVLSPERSGSTLLATMLGANTRVVAPPELFLMRYGRYDEWRRRKPAAWSSLAWLLARLGEDAARIDERFANQRIDEVYDWLLERIGPDRILIDKTPAYARDPLVLERAERLEPRYVWLIRHPLGVANSWIERREARRWSRAGRAGIAAGRWLAGSSSRPARWLGERLDAAAVRTALERWHLVHSNIERFASAVPEARRRVVFYEDLVTEPERVLHELCAWLGVPLESSMLEPWKHVPGGLARGTGDEKIRRHDRIRADRARSWRERMAAYPLDARTRSVMERLGIAE